MALTAEQAAKRLNRTERTVRRWIAEGKLTAFHPTHGNKEKYLLEESEVEQLAGELAQYEQPAEQGPVASEGIEKRLEYVENRLSEERRWSQGLEQRIEALEQLIGNLPGPDGEASPLPLQKHTEPTKRTRTLKAVEPPVPGAIQYWQFAKVHGVNRVTFRDQITKGMKRTGERVEAMRVEHELWLTPDQQIEALTFWQRHNVSFTLPHDQEQKTTL
jgi:excisionase family DNA binding protein